MRAILKTLAAAGAFVLCTGQAAPSRIDYTLTPLIEDGALTAVQFDLRFRGEADGETVLRLPGSWGGQDELWRGVEALAALSGAELHAGDDPQYRTLTHRPNARIHVRYRVVQDWEGPPSAGQGNTYRPAIQTGYFHLIGNAALVTPDGASQHSPVRLRVRNLPRGWRFASDLEHSGLRLGNVWASVMVGGDFRVVRGEDRNVRVAIRGDWAFSDQGFANEVSEIVAAQRRFWNDRSSPYLVTVIQLEAPNPGWLSIGGTGLGDAFAFFATPNAEAAHITRTLAHEGLHSWIPGAIGGLPDEDEAAHYWLSEGFTDFYTARLLVREGLWTPAQYAADLNEALRAYAQSPARAEPNARIVADFWSDRHVRQLPYQRGRFLAMIWDARMRAERRSMDDVMREMRHRAETTDTMKAGEMFPLAARYLGLDPSEEIVAHVEAGAPILLPEDVVAPCGRIVTREAIPFHRGFDIEATQANNDVIAGVDPALPAYAAGLRDGMVLLRRDGGQIGDPDQEITYVARDGESERAFTYMPRGRGTYTLQQLELDPTLNGARLARCVAVLGGG